MTIPCGTPASISTTKGEMKTIRAEALGRLVPNVYVHAQFLFSL